MGTYDGPVSVELGAGDFVDGEAVEVVLHADSASGQQAYGAECGVHGELLKGDWFDLDTAVAAARAHLADAHPAQPPTDPNLLLAKLREYAAEVIDAREDQLGDVAESNELALARAFFALDERLSRGEGLPAEWAARAASPAGQ